VRARLSAWAARGVRLTHLVDRAYRKFDRLRSALVVSLASDRFFDEYNALTYSATDSYQPGSSAFRSGLFDWEEEAVARYFPSPPARVLVGGAGGGREPFALVEKGYSVVAFDPAEPLVRGMAAAAPGNGRLRAYCGSYASMPLLRGADDRESLDLTGEPFDAAIVGWSSFSHLRSDRERVETLRAFGAVTNGPILVSYFPDPAATDTDGGDALRRWLRKRARRRGPSVFSIQIGYYRLLRHADVEEFVRQAGLVVVGAERGGNWPYVVVKRAG
jgi:hypothetical protein